MPYLETQNPSKARKIGKMILAILFVSGWLIWGMNAIIEGILMLTWKPLTTFVTYEGVYKHGVNRYGPIPQSRFVEVEFKVNGEKYKTIPDGDFIIYSKNRYNLNPTENRKYLGEIEIFYNPNNPKKCYLKKGGHLQDTFTTGFVLLFLGVLLVVAWYKIGLFKIS